MYKTVYDYIDMIEKIAKKQSEDEFPFKRVDNYPEEKQPWPGGFGKKLKSIMDPTFIDRKNADYEGAIESGLFDSSGQSKSQILNALKNGDLVYTTGSKSRTPYRSLELDTSFTDPVISGKTKKQLEEYRDRIKSNVDRGVELQNQIPKVVRNVILSGLGGMTAGGVTGGLVGGKIGDETGARIGAGLGVAAGSLASSIPVKLYNRKKQKNLKDFYSKLNPEEKQALKDRFNEIVDNHLNNKAGYREITNG